MLGASALTDVYNILHCNTNYIVAVIFAINKEGVIFKSLTKFEATKGMTTRFKEKISKVTM